MCCRLDARIGAEIDMTRRHVLCTALVISSTAGFQRLTRPLCSTASRPALRPPAARGDDADAKPLEYYKGMVTSKPSADDGEKDMLTPTLKLAGGASALLCFPPHSMGMGGIRHRPEMAMAHFRTVADATDLPLIVFQYGDELAYSLDTLVGLAEEIPSIKAVKDWSPPQAHARHIQALQNLSRPVNILSTNSSWLMSSLVMGANGLLSGAGSVIADMQVALFRAVQADDLATARAIANRMWYATEAFYADPFGDMHNRMKEALVHLGRQDRAVVRPPLVKLSDVEVARIGEAITAAGLTAEGFELRQAAE